MRLSMRLRPTTFWILKNSPPVPWASSCSRAQVRASLTPAFDARPRPIGKITRSGVTEISSSRFSKTSVRKLVVSLPSETSTMTFSPSSAAR